MRLKILLIAIAVAALFVAGCGGGDSSGTGASTAGSGGDGTTTNTSGSSGKPLTKAEFISKSNAICQEVPKNFSAKLTTLEKENGSKKPPKAEENLKAAVPPLYTAIQELEALTPPKGEEEMAEEVIAALEVAAKGLEEKPTSELAGPKSPFNEFQEVSKKYGLTSCTGL